MEALFLGHLHCAKPKKKAGGGGGGGYERGKLAIYSIEFCLCLRLMLVKDGIVFQYVLNNPPQTVLPSFSAATSIASSISSAFQSQIM